MKFYARFARRRECEHVVWDGQVADTAAAMRVADELYDDYCPECGGQIRNVDFVTMNTDDLAVGGPVSGVASALTRVAAGRYRLIGELGRGGTGTVWLAEDTLGGRKVAMRELRSSPADRGRLLREVRGVARVRHSNAVALLDVVPSEDDDAVYLIMELVEGPTLTGLVVGRGGKLSAPLVARFGLQLLDVLEETHALGTVHGDVKPGNVLIARGEEARLTDFGIARLVGGAGTLSFAAPEIVAGEPARAASDLWSLGATLFYAADGRVPFERDDDAATRDAILNGDIPVPDCDPVLAEAISGMLVRDPERRFTIARVREILGPLAQVSAWFPPPTTGPLPTELFSKSWLPGRSSTDPAELWVPARAEYGTPAAPPWDVPAPEPPPQRYLKGQCPQAVRVGKPFGVLARVTVASGTGTAPLKAFDVGPGGREVLLDLQAPELRILGPQRQWVRVPPDGDSEPVMFELEAVAEGPKTVEITAWADGTFLGQLNIETTATDRLVLRRRQQDVTAELDAEPVPGLVTLVVRRDPRLNSYRFEFRDEDNPEEVVSDLVYEPGPRVERLVAELDRLAKGRSGYSAAETRSYLVNAGAALWTELLPSRLREQFWERQDRISQLAILADSDVVPWELLYPLDPRHDEGFLVEQFPVTRMMFGRRAPRRLRLDPAWFVLPDDSPSRARAEVEAMLDLFYPSRDRAGTPPVMDGLTPLLERIAAGDFGLLHFACHNAFDPGDGSSIMLDRRQFTPTLLTTAAIGRVLAEAGPTVFINACRSAGASPSYHRLDGWASKFLEAGAAAFIGSLWAVRDSTARDFAAELYGHLQRGETLGNAVMAARRFAATEPGDPTWLAYAVYGDPRATLK